MRTKNHNRLYNEGRHRVGCDMGKGRLRDRYLIYSIIFASFLGKRQHIQINCILSESYSEIEREGKIP